MKDENGRNVENEGNGDTGDAKETNATRCIVPFSSEKVEDI